MENTTSPVDSEAPAHPVMLLIHGMGSSGDSWLPALDLVEGVTTRSVSLSKLAAGKEGRLMDRYVDGLASLVSAEYPDQEIVLVGHSLGSIIATRFAKKYAGTQSVQLSGLVLVSAPVRLAVGCLMGLRRAVAHPLALLRTLYFVFLASVPWSDRLRRFVFRFQLGRLLVFAPLDRKPSTMTAALAYSVTTVGDRSSVKSSLEEFRDFDPDVAYSEVPVRTFLVYGDRDRLVTKKDLRWARTAMPDARLVQLTSTCHWPHVQDAKSMAELLSSLVAELDS